MRRRVFLHTSAVPPYALALTLCTLTLSLVALQQSVTVQSSGQSKFLAQIKDKISANAPNHMVGKYPFDDLWVHPPNPTMLKSLKLEDHHLRSVFVWIPEFTFPRAFPEGRPPCPRCMTTSQVIAKGFTQRESRRAVLRDSCCDLLGYFYHCKGCESNNKGKAKVRLTKPGVLGAPSSLAAIPKGAKK